MTERDGPALGRPDAPLHGSTVSPSVHGDSISSTLPDSDIPCNGSTMAVTVSRSLNPPGTESCSTDPVARARDCLHRLFSGLLGDDPLEPVSIPLPGRRPAEYHAASRALACTDLFAIDCSDRVVRERAIADVARAAAATERVLILSPDAAAADRLIELLGLHEPVSVLRALADDENPLRPNPALNRFTSAAAGNGRVERLRRESGEALERLEAELAAVEAAQSALPDIRSVSERIAALDRDIAEVTERHRAVEPEVLAEAESRPPATPYAEAMQRWRTDRDAVCGPLAAERDAFGAARAQKEAELAQERRRLDEAGKRPGFFGRILGLSRVQTDTVQLESRIQELETEVKNLAAKEAAKQAEHDAAEKRLGSERDKRVAAEVAARRVDLNGRLAALTLERDAAAARLAAWSRDVEKAGIARPQPDVPLDRIAAGLDARAEEVRTQLTTTRECCDGLRHRGHELARQFLMDAAVIVGTPGSLRCDPIFTVLHEGAFGLLILDHAEELTQADFLDLAPLADRWLLAGDSGRGAQPRGNGLHPHRHAHPHPGFFKQVARRLDREPWSLDGDRLVLRLVHLSPEQRRFLTCEPVIDVPEIELRVSGHDGDAALAEIAFPSDTSIADAKRFLVSQLGEVLLRPSGDPHWHDDAGSLVACWPVPDSAAIAEEWVELEAGVQEKVSGAGIEAFTSAIAFDSASGWDRTRAEAWLDTHLPRRHGRLAVLPPSHSGC